MRNQLPVETRSLLIRPFVVEDVPVVLALSNEETLRTWLPSQVYGGEAEARSVVEDLIAQYETPGDPRRGPFVLAVEHRDDRALIGHVGFSPLEGEVEIGYAIGQRYQRRGFASEAVYAASRWMLDAFDLRRVLGITTIANIASRRTLVRAGYARQPDQVMRHQGIDRQVSVYALVRVEPEGKTR